MTHELAARWSLDPSITFLNHGSFGACPTAVLEAQARLRARLEAEPVRFFVREAPALLYQARAALAAFVGADPDDLGFVPNATTGVNAVVRSLSFAPGDEILATDHGYNACRNTLEYVAERSGARVVTASIPFPGTTEDAIVRAIVDAVGPRTRLALVDHVTSPTGLVFPIARVAAELGARGVDVLVDGAHAPGMLALDVASLGVAYYTGNCHKWLCAPKGAAFLWVRRDRQERIHPTTTSHGRNATWMEGSLFRREFDWTGTDDPTAYLCVPEAIACVGAMVDGGWSEVRRRNRALAVEARRLLCEALGIEAPCPDELIGSLAAVPLPDAPPVPGLDPLQEHLYHARRIEVPVIPWPAPGKRLLRFSAQLYNEIDQYRRLSRAVLEWGR